MHHLLGFDDASENAAWVWTDHRVAPCSDVCLRNIVQRGFPECPTLVEFKGAEFGVAKANRVLQHGLEYRLKFAG